MTIRLILALHGVGASAADMMPVAHALGEAAGAEALALDGLEPFDMASHGRQWFSVKGVTDADRPARVAAALPALLVRIDALCTDRGLERRNVALVGFSQGAIMALAAIAAGEPFGSVIAIAGRLAAGVRPLPAASPQILLIHDLADPIMPFTLAGAAQAELAAAGYDIRLIVTNGYGHAIGPRTLQAATNHLITRPSGSAQETRS
ncbi:hypothetical protein CLG96_04095 [Sphingomonas oleivorans]|uniref:Phospholipase/carboxylesterase/thioesterase domain-containing protein n=1 Tax=Sphingomonas oleivorans TaxID=1735121 RepID=A0A2T5G2D1_9SPHN|nr:hypothetical protein [Sphingomonas oleivorans]PTQ13298.1 hypothetical protein CLG96_04095 [Sphingomonas oleivorans]